MRRGGGEEEKENEEENEEGEKRHRKGAQIENEELNLSLFTSVVVCIKPLELKQNE